MSKFKRDFLGGVAYTALSKYAGIFIQLFISFILARLLDPSDFGVLAIATVIIGFLNNMTNFGLRTAVIQSNTINENDIRSLFSFTLLVGLVVGGAFFMSAESIASYYNNENLVNVIRLLSVNVVFAALNIMPNALMLKAKMFKQNAIRSLSMHILGGAIGVFLAYKGFGLYALVSQSMLSAIGIFIFNYLFRPIRFFAPIRKSALSKVLNFSIYMFLADTFNYCTKNIDKPLVGRFLSMDMLGYYDKSYRLMMLPVQNLSYVVGPVMQPLFRDFQNDRNQMCDKYCKLLKFMSIIAFPLSMYLFFASPDLIHFFYGNKWDAAIAPFRILSLSVAFQILLSTSGPVFLSSNRPKLSFINCIIEFVLSISCLIIGLLLGGLNIVSAAMACGIFCRFVYIYTLLTKVIFKVSFKYVISKIILGMIIAIFLSICLTLVNMLITSDFSIARMLLEGVLFIAFVVISLNQTGFVKLRWRK